MFSTQAPQTCVSKVGGRMYTHQNAGGTLLGNAACIDFSRWLERGKLIHQVLIDLSLGAPVGSHRSIYDDMIIDDQRSS